jgi:ribosomal protein S18 acetylase RimI-like enzyme
MENLTKGVEKEELSGEEKLVLSDFEKMKLLSELKIKEITSKDFPKAMEILNNELGKERVRDEKFLYEKFKKFPQFFMGIFLDEEIIGIICGFPREDYLLMSEVAVDSRFQSRGFGKKLVEEFETTLKNTKYKKINVGAYDNKIGFYKSINYKPFLLIQFKEGDYKLEDFDALKIIKHSPGSIELKIEKCSLEELEKFRKKYAKAHLQYIFTKMRALK